MMIRRTAVWLCALALSFAPPRVLAEPREGVLAIVGCQVLSMEADPMRDAASGPQTILVRNGRIAAVGPVDRIEIPASAKVIDGRGRTVLPGLYDLYAHVHEGALALFLASGVTTVRNAAPGLAAHLALRNEVNSGARIGPRIFSTGPVLDGIAPSYASVGPLASVSAAEAIVASQAHRGFDAIMVYAGIEPLPYLAVLGAARRLGLPVTGHLPHRVPREIFYRAGQHSKENLIGEIDLISGSMYVPTAYRDADARAIAAAGMWTVPTLTIHRMRANRDRRALYDQAGLHYLPPRQIAHWKRAEGRLYAVSGYTYGDAPELVRRLHAAGARIGVGTDAGYPFIVPGEAMHDELANLRDAGLAPITVLRAATRGGAEYLGELETAGTIAVGKRADLIIVRGDPLADMAILRKPDGVIAAGRWFSRPALQAHLAAQARAYRADRDRFAAFDPLEEPAGRTTDVRFRVMHGELVIGEERVRRVEHDGGARTLQAQSSIDPHLETRTDMRVRFDAGGQAQTVRIKRWVAGAEWIAEIGMEAGALRLRAQLPHGERLDRVEALAPAAILGGPLQAVNLDLDMTGTLQMVVDSAVDLSLGEAALIRAVRAEFNEEEHGHEWIGDTGYWVVREPADGAVSGTPTDAGATTTRHLRVFVQGPNGSGTSVIEIDVDADGWIGRVREADGGIRIERVASGSGAR